MGRTARRQVQAERAAAEPRRDTRHFKIAVSVTWARISISPATTGVCACSAAAACRIIIIGCGGGIGRVPGSSTRIDAIDRPAGARRSRLGARPRVDGGAPQCFALERLPLLHVEANALDGSRAARDRSIHHLAHLRHVVDSDLDDVARDVALRHLPAVDPLGVDVQFGRNRANRILRDPASRKLLLHRGHGLGGLRLRLARIARPISATSVTHA